ncbi:MAG: class I SAM-dependent methyltransferase [Bacteroidota bacterium]
MFESRMDMFRNRLVKVFRHLGRQARRQGIACYRLYDHDLPEFPLRIEIYGDQIYLSEYKRSHGMTEEIHDQWLEAVYQVIEEIIGVPGDRIHGKLRQRKLGRQGQYQRTGEEQAFFEVNENGLRFWVNLTDYLDTGLFLDHRITRQMVRAEAVSKRVLNLFAYTGSFSVYAAAGGAKEVCTVDLSNTYLDWSRRNMGLNGFEGNKYSFIQADVKSYLTNLSDARFDLIILDPPTFSNSKRMEQELDVQRDHVGLIRECLRILSPGGLLYFSNNYTKFQLDRDALPGTDIKDITRATTPFDFDGRLNRPCYLIKNPG